MKIEGKPTFYAILYNDFRKAALQCGYALSLHGSMARDMDLIAVAWTEEAKSAEELVKVISSCIGETVWKEHHFKNPELKPNGRIAYTLSITGDWFIDLSIIPPKKKLKEALVYDLLKQYNSEDISFSKFVELLNMNK